MYSVSSNINITAYSSNAIDDLVTIGGPPEIVHPSWLTPEAHNPYEHHPDFVKCESCGNDNKWERECCNFCGAQLDHYGYLDDSP